MNPGRRAFLQRAFQITGGAVGLSATGAVLAERISPIFDETRIDTYVSGVPFHIGMKTRPSEVFHVGQALRVVREVENPHDDNALALYMGTRRVGYIPRKDNGLIGHQIEQGREASIRVTSVNNRNAWEGVRVKVTLT